MYAPASDDEIEAIFAKRLSGEGVTREEELKFRLHLCCLSAQSIQNVTGLSTTMDANVTTTPDVRPPWTDTGYDCINNYDHLLRWQIFLNFLNKSGNLQNHHLSLTRTTTRQSNDLRTLPRIPPLSQIQQGSAWWFNDHKTGMQDQMISCKPWKSLRFCRHADRLQKLLILHTPRLLPESSAT